MQATVAHNANGRGGPAHRVRVPLAPAAEKARLRAECLERRARIGAGARAKAAAQIADNVLAAVALAPAAVVSGYWPFADEVDPRPLMIALHARGHPLCLPVAERPGTPLAFRAWAPGEALTEGVFATSVPAPDRPRVVPDCLLVPLLAFDRDGYRLGFGAGYYDLTLAALEGSGRLSVGLAFAAQEVSRLPREPHDMALDWIVTERGALHIGAAR